MKVKLSVVIVNWNVTDLLLNCIESIYKNNQSLPIEIIVIDNASSDKSFMIIKDLYPEINLIQNNHNMGFAYANNIGLGKCTGEYILLLNPDTLIIKNALQQMVDYLDSNPTVGMVGPMLLSSEKSPPAEVAARRTRTLVNGLLLDVIYIKNFPIIGEYISKRLRYPYDLCKVSEVEAISGAAMMFRSSLLSSIGTLNDNFFMTAEDVEWCDRVRKSGSKIVYLPEAKILHFGSSCTPINPVEIWINSQMSIVRYYGYKYGLLGKIIYRMIIMFIAIPKIMIGSIYFRIKGNRKRSTFNSKIALGLLKGRYVGDAAFLNGQD